VDAAGAIRREAVRQRVFSVVALGLCAMAGAALAVVPLTTIMAFLAVVALAAVASLTVGVTGALATAPAFLSFFLLNRFDQGFALPVGDYIVKVNYWFAAVSIGLLAIMNALLPSREIVAGGPLVRFARYFGLGLSLFALLGLLSIVSNAAFDRYVPDRSLLGELLALGSLCLPMLLLLAVVRSNLTKDHALMCLRGLVAFAAGTGFVMVVFALLPQTVTAMLGWSRELVIGSGGLIRGQTPLGHPNTVSAVMVLLLPVILGLRHRSPLWTPFYLGSALFLMGGVLFSLSRTAASIALVVLAMCLLYILGAGAWKHILSIAVAGVFVAVVVWAGLSLFGAYDFSRFWSTRYFENANIERRVQTIVTSLRVMRDYPVLGASPNSVYPRDELQPDWVPADVDQLGPIIYYRGHLTAANPHNVFLTVLAEFGFLGGAVFFALMALVLHTIWRAWRAEALTELDRATTAAFAIAFVGFMGVSLGGSLFTYTIRVGLIFWTFLALAVRYSLLAAQENRDPA